MTRNTVRFTVDLSIHLGKLGAFEEIARAMIAGSQPESGTLGYDWCLSGDRTRCRLVEMFADGPATLAHLQGPVVQELVPKLLETSTIDRFEVYGDPGPEAGEMLVATGAEIFHVWNGIER